jgi:hypothetical protein
VAVRAVRMADVAAAGAEFLLSRQSESGCWTDWDLPPGPSSTWTTAYVGLRLAELSGVADALGAAARLLRDHELDGGAWGYDDRVGCDCDSTAHAVLFLARTGAPAGDAAYVSLLGFQQADGGFSTYAADAGLGSWGESHPDVTPVAVRALLTRPRRDHAAIARGLRYVAGARGDNGLWRSFWWASPLYATCASLVLLSEAGAGIALAPTRRALRQARPRNPFERALLLESLVLAGAAGEDAAESIASALADEQLDDGSWPSAPVLRVTARDCSAPWEVADTGPLYGDPNRLFTSATVVGALARYGNARVVAGLRRYPTAQRLEDGMWRDCDTYG